MYILIWIFENHAFIILILVFFILIVHIALWLIILIDKVLLLHLIIVVREIIILILFLNKLIMPDTSKFFSQFILLHHVLKILIIFGLLTIYFLFTTFHQLLVDHLRSREISIFINCIFFVFLIHNFFDLIS